MMLGQATEKLLERTFERVALITAARAAEILGIDEKTLGRLVDAGAIQPVLVSERTKRYAEADLRAYLARRTEIKPCQSTSQTRAVSGSMTSSTSVVGFTAARAKRRNGGRSRWSKPSA